MPIYLRFNDDGYHVETTTLSKKPEGDGWVKAPPDFDGTKRYQLVEGDKVVEANPEALADDQLKRAKAQGLLLVRQMIDTARQKYVGYSNGKTQAYTVQAIAAEHILTAIATNQKVDDKDAQVVEPLAHIRNLSVEAMAHVIQHKAQKAVFGLATCERREDEAEQAIEQISKLEDLHQFLATFTV